MLANRFARLNETPVRYATSPALANYLRIVSGAHGLTPHHPAVTRRQETLAGPLLHDALGGDADALGILMDHLQHDRGRSLMTPEQLAMHPTLHTGGPTLTHLLMGLHHRTLGTGFEENPFPIEEMFSPDALAHRNIVRDVQMRHRPQDIRELANYLHGQMGMEGDQFRRPLLAHLDMLRGGQIGSLPHVLGITQQLQQRFPGAHMLGEQAQGVGRNAQDLLQSQMHELEAQHLR